MGAIMCKLIGAQGNDALKSPRLLRVLYATQLF
jgi:hypothetical protein